jgi:hypothetical protein
MHRPPQSPLFGGAEFADPMQRLRAAKLNILRPFIDRTQSGSRGMSPIS